eukprot:TRINITY_DN8978_c0_g2_i1.p1 TRINITY_DN8978_c0_g2~~TRINITY_DN8978_c0_g2_i1.p1  ORF type:complete len:116 (-),score=4.26 TRINITY_DN8978_c0_g2_i1:111-458(-)
MELGLVMGLGWIWPMIQTPKTQLVQSPLRPAIMSHSSYVAKAMCGWTILPRNQYLICCFCQLMLNDKPVFNSYFERVDAGYIDCNFSDHIKRAETTVRIEDHEIAQIIFFHYLRL